MEQSTLNNGRAGLLRKQLAACTKIELPVGPFRPQLGAFNLTWNASGQRIQEPKDHVLNEAALVAVRKITARSPTVT